MIETANKKRTSLTLDPSVIAMYQDIARKSNVSLSSLINDWLQTTGPALETLTAQVLEVKHRPHKVLNDLMLFQEHTQAQLDSLHPELRGLLGGRDKENERPEPVIGEDERTTQKAAVSPPSNTGLKVYPPRPGK
jgi:hypothetical protein